MPTVDINIDVGQIRARATDIMQQLLAPDQVGVTIAALFLSIVFILAVAAIWRGRRRTSAPIPAPSSGSGFTRWLTPMGMKSIPAEQAVVVRPRRTSGSNRTIRVSTPVSKVPTRALRSATADALTIARKTGLARDAVAMMMANANPHAAARKQDEKTLARPIAAQPAPRAASQEKAMTAPGAYASAARTSGAPTPRPRTLGTHFNARLS